MTRSPTMKGSLITPAGRRLMWRSAVISVFLISFAFFSIWAFYHYRPTGPMAWLLALLPSLGIIGQMAVFGVYLSEEKDELNVAILVKSMLWSIGGTLSVTTVCGYLEAFAHIRRLELLWVYPIFVVFQTISSLLVRWRYR